MSVPISEMVKYDDKFLGDIHSIQLQTTRVSLYPHHASVLPRPKDYLTRANKRKNMAFRKTNVFVREHIESVNRTDINVLTVMGGVVRLIDKQVYFLLVNVIHPKTKALANNELMVVQGYSKRKRDGQMNMATLNTNITRGGESVKNNVTEVCVT
ncbi:hypothetical protein BCR41DRAFT_370313 [Lobosporangium transversale]|uniref:Uncharacterized protein n=1 Tax=Lobosporangium transversale TaxID=64571 RepID=A0A1Y2GP71_9FUNG|nr:hypothetical protein BCR41DRAFT_370313 [Lobosporangium transversale]ORZ17500.1 hypothetical protein BCR41DRAFT_370313 [Lobosporangium transversale]|eukprot:XP_021881887.1 hypothetical protein BCR41DRAFT_370313 [Lobosporangium transversale]